MFQRFLSAYGPVDDSAALAPWEEPALMKTPGYATLAAKVAGLDLGHGLLRIHAKGVGPLAQRLVRGAFPEFAERAVPFAHDWLGRQFAVDRARNASSEPQLLLLEPGSGEVFEIDSSFTHFFEVNLVDDPDTYLASDLFLEWLAHSGQAPGPGQCVGFKVPLFLGGADSVANLDLTDLEVYWEMCGQMRAVARDLPPGTRIGRATRRDA